MPKGSGPPKVNNYLLTYLDQRVPVSKQGTRNREELMLLATSLDAMTVPSDISDQSYDESKARAADQLMQRFKCIEQSLMDGDWYVASQMSIVPKSDQGLTSQSEKEASLAARMRDFKFAEAKKKFGGD